VAIGGRALPWTDPILFAELMLSWDMRSYHIANQQAGLVFFDRGVPDAVGYLRLSKVPVPAYFDMAAETFRYSRRVFIAPPWPEIFQQDRERKQDFDEALRTFETLAATYTALGYELVDLPRVPIAERVHFVLRYTALAPPT
jgi:predicted ATPase